MPRSGAIYTLPEAAFVPNTPISSAAVNSDFDDIADALTDSLARNGQGGMLAVLPLDNTGFVYLTDPNTGIRRTAADTQAIKCGGVDVVEIASTGATVNGDLEVTGDVTVGGNPILKIGEIQIWTGRTAPDLWTLCDGGTRLRADFPDLWTFAAAEIAAGNILFTNGNGTTTFTVPDLRGRAPFGNDGGAGRLTSATMTPDGITQGAVGGEQTHTLITAELASHTHVNILSDPGHAHTFTSASNFVGQQGAATANVWQGSAGTGTTTTVATGVVITNAAAGSGSAHNNMPPAIVVNFILYAGA